MRISTLISAMWLLLLVGCQTTLPSTSNEQGAYPIGEAPTSASYPAPNENSVDGTGTVDGNGTVDGTGTVDGGTTSLPEIEPITPLNNDMDITQPGAFIVKVIPHDIPYMLRARTDTHQVDVTLAGIYSADLGNPLCNDIVKERLRLLTSNPAATFTMNVISSDPNNPGAVIAQVVRHDNVDIGLDLVASGYAVLKDQPFEGFEQYLALRDVARTNLYGMWNQGECQFSPFYLEGQSAKQTTTAAR